MRRVLRAVVAAVAMVVATVVFVQPASAATYNASYGGVEAQLDTAPGNGYQSWIWLYVPGDAASGRVEYKYFDGTGGTEYTAPDTTATWNFTKKVQTIRACRFTLFGGQYYWICSAWTSCCVDRVAAAAAQEGAVTDTPRALDRRARI
ncbi:hypothetical protein [Streptomyces sp. NPDC001068]|uniref:hypothetical protein n=1 Tax=Streptomyces sp. NPDC001068 TaxID=3364544 RepID=UPI003697ED07